MSPEEIEQSEEEYMDRLRDHLAKLEAQEAARKQAKLNHIDSRTLRTPEAAKYLGVSEWTLRRMVHDGEITCIRGKYWTFDKQVLDAWLERNQE
jgi:excisionase family DNA binding protein